MADLCPLHGGDQRPKQQVAQRFLPFGGVIERDRAPPSPLSTHRLLPPLRLCAPRGLLLLRGRTLRAGIRVRPGPGIPRVQRMPASQVQGRAVGNHNVFT